VHLPAIAALNRPSSRDQAASLRPKNCLTTEHGASYQPFNGTAAEPDVVVTATVTERLSLARPPTSTEKRGGNVSKPDYQLDLLADRFADADTAWSIGSFGAIAEFMRDADEHVVLDYGGSAIAAVTARGGLRLIAHEKMRPVASESLTTQSWSHRVSLCLPEDNCRMEQRTVVTEVGPDTDALRAEDRAAVLFDLGLGTLQLNACIRTGDANVVAALRKWTGRSLFEPGNGATAAILAGNPHRVFISRLGRVEVYQPIPPPKGKSPEGPHTHVLPRLLRHKRTHAATEFVPAGLVPCAHLYPPHPARDCFGKRTPFCQNRHASFQDLLVRFGESKFVDIKRKVYERVSAADTPVALSDFDDRFSRAALRITLRQIKASGAPAQAIESWLAACDSSIP
jgi:hypothetical protein